MTYIKAAQKSNKDFMLRVRLDNNTLAKLDTLCKSEKKDRSKIVREAIHQRYDKQHK